MITARNLAKKFDGFTALDDVSFEFEDGEIFGIIGHNGAGKTTLLKIISGLITPTSGSLYINDIDVVKHPIALKEALGYLPEESRLYETMTAENYIAFFGEIYGLSAQEISLARLEQRPPSAGVHSAILSLSDGCLKAGHKCQGF